MKWWSYERSSVSNLFYLNSIKRNDVNWRQVDLQVVLQKEKPMRDHVDCKKCLLKKKGK